MVMTKLSAWKKKNRGVYGRNTCNIKFFYSNFLHFSSSSGIYVIYNKLEPLSNHYRTSISPLLNHYQTSIERLLNYIEYLSNIINFYTFFNFSLLAHILNHYRTIIERLSDYRTTFNHYRTTFNHRWTSIKLLLDHYRMSIKPLLNNYQTSIELLSNIY